MQDLYMIHSGILGQKWGKRNGPPYPLKASEHSASERKAGLKGWTKEAKAEVRRRKDISNLSDEDLQKANKRAALERQYKKDHEQEYQTGVDKVWKVNQNANDVVRNTKNIADQIERNTRKKVSTSDIDISKLTDAELAKMVNRMNLEARYNQMTTKEVSNRGAVAAREALEVIGSVVGIVGGTVAIIKAVKG